MIRCYLSILMGREKYKIADVARITELNRSTISSLYKETATRVDLEAVDKLCRLFECKVSDLFEWVDESEGT